VEEVTAIARRGPAERKYNPKEIRAVCANISRDALAAEFQRIGARLEAVSQHPDTLLKEMTDEFGKCEPTVSQTKMGFRFLASPKRVLTDGNNRVRALELEETKLEPKGQDTAAVGLKQYYEFPCDSVVFAVGDKVDETVGLPYKNGVFVTNPNKSNNDPDDALFQAYDEASGKIVDGIFLTGWARKASEGLVGIAKRDGEWCVEVLTRYLESKPLRDRAELDGVLRRLRERLQQRQVKAIEVEGLRVLEAAEHEHKTSQDCIGEFKFVTNQEMLDLIQGKRKDSHAPASR
jgi:ferredoxin--NADP+ reductase